MFVCLCVCARVRAYIHTTMHTWKRLGDNLQELAFSFHQVGPGEAWWQGDGHLYSQTHLAGCDTLL